MTEDVAIHWFRQDLRVSDNPALTSASKNHTVLPIYIFDEENAGEYSMGGASKHWLHYSLKSLNNSLENQLSLYRGNPLDILSDLIDRFGAQAVYWNRCYEPWRMKRDEHIKSKLLSMGIKVESSNGSLLWEPWEIKKSDGSPYKVFTPFYKKGCLKATPPREPLPRPDRLICIGDEASQLKLKKLNLLPNIRWDEQLKTHWVQGERGAGNRFQQFIEEGLQHYKEGRNSPAKPYVSRLSPHLHFGEISPNQLWYAIRSLSDDKNSEHFCRELGWREFSHSLLYYNHDLPNKNLQSKFNHFPWVDDEVALEAWKKGQTGVPMVDAGMRELWQTGFMHNRVRMIVGSFLVKNLRLHWKHGERWFWDTLVDANLANNSASWQWIAGCGADAAPYFRIFNPVKQGEKFDPDGSYVRQYLPEIAALPNKYLFNPWEAPEHILKEANIELGKTYPKPIVDLKLSRNLALKSYQSLKGSMS